MKFSTRVVQLATLAVSCICWPLIHASNEHIVSKKRRRILKGKGSNTCKNIKASKKSSAFIPKILAKNGKNFFTCEEPVSCAEEDLPTVDVQNCLVYDVSSNGNNGSGAHCLGTGGVALRFTSAGGGLQVCCYGEEYEKLYILACSPDSPCAPPESYASYGSPTVTMRPPPFYIDGVFPDTSPFGIKCPENFFENLDNLPSINAVTF